MKTIFYSSLLLSFVFLSAGCSGKTSSEQFKVLNKETSRFYLGTSSSGILDTKAGSETGVEYIVRYSYHESTDTVHYLVETVRPISSGSLSFKDSESGVDIQKKLAIEDGLGACTWEGMKKSKSQTVELTIELVLGS